MRARMLLAPLVAILLAPAASAVALGSYVFADGESYASHAASPGLSVANRTAFGHRYLEIQTPVAALVAVNVSTSNGAQLRVIVTHGTDDAVLASLLDAQHETMATLNDIQARLAAASSMMNATSRSMDQLANASRATGADLQANGRVLTAANSTLASLADGLANASRQLAGVAAALESLPSQGREHRELAEAIEAREPQAPPAADGLGDAWLWTILAAGAALAILVAYRRKTARAPALDAAPATPPPTVKPRRTRKAPKTQEQAPETERQATPRDVEAALRKTLGLDAGGTQ